MIEILRKVFSLVSRHDTSTHSHVYLHRNVLAFDDFSRYFSCPLLHYFYFHILATHLSHQTLPFLTLFAPHKLGNLPNKITRDEVLKSVVKVLGPGCVSDLRLSLDENMRPRGFGYIELKDESMVDRAIDELSGLDIGMRAT